MTCLTEEEIINYLGNREKFGGYGWHITEPNLFFIPFDLFYLNVERAPQSWQYKQCGRSSDDCGNFSRKRLYSSTSQSQGKPRKNKHRSYKIGE